MRTMKISLALFISILFFITTSAQNNLTEFSILFYNVENLFDLQNDSLTVDDEFTPEGDRHWTYKRLQKKLLNTSKVILNTSGWNAPSLIALCEIENRYVLEQLRNETPLKTIPYKIIHKDSPDFRGIDVALLYNSDVFYPIEYDYYPLLDRNGNIRKSREILYVSGIMGGIDTVHVFVNHWPSRYSGVMETREFRNNAARLLREKVDALFEQNTLAKIIILGDFNDQPSNESLHKYLNAKSVSGAIKSSELYNLSKAWMKADRGTLKYQSQWFVFDQVIVSGELLQAKNGLSTKSEWATIGSFPALFETDKTHGGTKLNRTYTGFKYNDGFSDHLPVLLKLKAN